MENEELIAVQRQIDVLNARLGQALGRGDLDSARALHAELAELDVRRMHLLERATAGDRPAAPHTLDQPQPPALTKGNAERPSAEPDASERPLREAVLDYLHLTGRPTSVQLLTDLARARDDYRLPGARLASLRRDEERSFRSTASRPTYVVPALTYDRFTPVRGVLASSAWPLPLRLIAPASSRVDFLHTVIALTRDGAARSAIARQSKTDSTGQRMDLLLRKLARTIPDALEPSHVLLDLDRIVQAASAELAVIETADADERNAAADRARTQLQDPAERLFGHKPTVITNRNHKEA
ncbi:hypothetical protein ACFQ36_03475 [Arthrobacter sp. GCM10027362]|uniref:hypothetical protein n=1 Tax=Arthrobacter sp. GCM10027362 TaxID=3273379 RepID=UPI003641F96B